MEQSRFLRALELFSGSDIVRKFSFRMINTRERSAHLHDCFECLSPHEPAAYPRSFMFGSPVQSKQSAQGIFMPKYKGEYYDRYRGE